MLSTIFRIVLFVVCWKSSAQTRQCGLYGSPPCTYVPAPPGMTPICASPGKTFCESVKHYPAHVIRHLIHKWGYAANDLIVDETTDEFEATRTPQSAHFFDSPYFPQHNSFQFDGGYDYPKPKRPFTGIGGDTYLATSEPIFIQQPSPPKRRPYDRKLGYTSYGQSSQNNPKKYYSSNLYVTEYNPGHWLKRYARDLSKKEIFTLDDFDFTTAKPSNETDISENIIEKEDSHVFKEKGRSRLKRQSPGRESLCQANFQYITPQAALNSQGNWMYVVNMVDTSRQLVRTETCISSVCSNLCQLPNGYNSRCEQKFVQKRLIALNGDGQNLYTDTFWFPSCCACTISNQ